MSDMDINIKDICALKNDETSPRFLERDNFHDESNGRLYSTVLYEMDFRLRIRDDQLDCNEQVFLKHFKVTD
jgi:hypothetical protein